MLLEYADATNIFEIVGLDVPPDVLESFRPLLVRVETDHRDMPERHWTKALVALSLEDRLGWVEIAGFHPTQDVPFVPRATFEFNMQGLIAHELVPGRQHVIERSLGEDGASEMALAVTLRKFDKSTTR
jgi:hypothetical protein